MAELIRKKETGGNYTNLYTQLGIKLIKGAYDELIKFPPMKDYLTNNSRLENGVRYLAKQQYTKVNEKAFSIQFIMYAASKATLYQNLETFLGIISAGAFELKITTLGKVFRLVYTDCQRLETYRGKYATFELALIEPDPTNREETSNG